MAPSTRCVALLGLPSTRRGRDGDGGRSYKPRQRETSRETLRGEFEASLVRGGGCEEECELSLRAVETGAGVGRGGVLRFVILGSDSGGGGAHETTLGDLQKGGRETETTLRRGTAAGTQRWAGDGRQWRRSLLLSLLLR